MHNDNELSNSPIEVKSPDGDFLILQDAFRVEEYDPKDGLYLVTSLIAESQGYVSLPKSEEEMDALEALIDLGVIPGISGGWISCSDKLELNHVYYGDVKTLLDESAESYPEFTVEAEVRKWGYALSHATFKGQFLKSIAQDDNGLVALYTDSPLKALNYESLTDAMSYYKHYHKLFKAKGGLSLCIYYVMRDIIHICILDVR